GQSSKSIGVGMAHSVSAVEAAGRTRVVVNLVRTVPYDMNLQGNSLFITLGSGAAMEEAAAAAASPAAGRTGGASISNVDFRRGDQGEGRVIVTLSDPSVPVNMTQEGGQIVVDFIGTNLPSEYDRRLDVVDFATPVKEIDTRAYAGGT